MTIDRKFVILAGAGAVLLAASIGFIAARVFDPHTSAASSKAGHAGHGEAGHDEHGDSHGDEHGDKHEEGFVKLKPADAPAAGVELAHVERGGGVDLLLPGRVAPMANAQSAVGAPLGGVVVEMHVAAGTVVRKGAPVASIRSPEGAAMRAEMVSAQAALEQVEATDRRDTLLLEQRAISRQQFELSRAATLKARADLQAAEAKLAAMGSPSASGVVQVRSPIAGTVMRISSTPGAVLAAGQEIAAIADLGKTELVFEAPPASSGAIAVGSHIEGRGASGVVIEAEVVGVAPGVAGAGATVRARVLGNAPPSGTIISGRIAAGAGDTLTVPSEAVQTVEGRPVVFVAEAEGFRATPVTAGRISGGRTEIINGLKGGEKIAGAGAFLLKAELGKGEAGHDH